MTPEKQPANLISNRDSQGSEEQEFMESPPLTQPQVPNAQPTMIETRTGQEQGPQLQRILTQDLGQFVRSKRDLW